MSSLALLQTGQIVADARWEDYLVIVSYFAFTIGIGFLLRRRMQSSEDFFLSGRSLPSWVTGLAFVGANLGALEILGEGAGAAQYGIMQTHFFWVGAIPAMVFLGIFMMPFYYGSRTHSVPGFLQLRFNEATRGFNAFTFAIVTVLLSGVNMYAMAIVFRLLLGWSLFTSLLVASAVLVVYLALGGLTAAIYNEVLQFFLTVLGLLPLTILGLRDVGGWSGVQQRVDDPQFFHLWANTGGTDNPMGVSFVAIFLGLGLVLSFGYWTTDFVVVQRALSAEDEEAARRTPLVGAFPKLLYPALSILPGLIALAIFPKLGSGGGFTPESYNFAIPLMMIHYLPTGLLGLGLTALMAAFMSGMAGNVTAFNTVWTYDIYRAYIYPNASDQNLLNMGRIATLVGIALSVGTAYIVLSFNSLFDYVQTLGAIYQAPLFAVFLIGMFWTRGSPWGGFWGLIVGTIVAIGIYIGQTLGLITLGEAGTVGGAFWQALLAFIAALLVGVVVSLFTSRKPESELQGLVYGMTEKDVNAPPQPLYKNVWLIGGSLLVMLVVLNIIFY